MENYLIDTDSYKCSHWTQYPPNTTKLMSYVCSRGGQFDKTLFFGLQMILKKTLCNKITKDMIEEASDLCKLHGEPFNYDGWMYIAEELNGKIPLKIKAVKEGMVIDNNNALMTIENTDDSCPWLTSWFETLLLRVWYPITVATLSYHVKKNIENALKISSDDLSEIDFKLHDFGSRGVSSRESAEIGGLAHLVNFKGTDTMVALLAGRRYYNEHMAGFSIPATEHSTITSWGKDKESAAYANVIKQFSKPGSIYACVSDSYDLWNAIENIWGDELKFAVINSGGRLVVRPDSGNPTEVVLKTIQLLEKKFGSKTNSKGYKVLSDCVRVIQGDGCNFVSINEILQVLIKNGYSASNIAFGMGGGLLQQVNRDTQKFAYKCCWGIIDGKSVNIFKDPVTDLGKKSKSGKLETVKIDDKIQTIDSSNENNFSSIMDVVYENGELIREQTFQEIRDIANKY